MNCAENWVSIALDYLVDIQENVGLNLRYGNVELKQVTGLLSKPEAHWWFKPEARFDILGRLLGFNLNKIRVPGRAGVTVGLGQVLHFTHSYQYGHIISVCHPAIN